MKKKVLLICFLLIVLSANVSAQNGEESFYYSIKGSVGKANQVKKVCVEYEIGAEKKENCAAVKTGVFSFRGNIVQPIPAKITTDNIRIKPLKVFLGNNEFELKITEEIGFVKKNQIQTEYENLIVTDNIRPNYFALFSELGRKKDEKGLAQISRLFDALKIADTNIAYIYLKNNPQSPLSVYAFERFASFQDDFSSLEKDFSELPDWIKNSSTGSYIRQKIEGAKAVAINRPAPLFSQRAEDGKTIGLENYRGKYVLLDFWASWCSPCRKEHPDFLRISQKYQTKGFEIFSVSIDEDKEAWLRASKTDKISWTNILDIKGSPDEIAVKYGVQAIPANFLINPQGIIVAKNLKAADLEKTLSDLIK